MYRKVNKEALFTRARSQGRCHNEQILYVDCPKGEEWSATAFHSTRDLFAVSVYTALGSRPRDSSRGHSEVRIHRLHQGTCLLETRTEFPHGGRIQELQFSPSGNTLCVAWRHGGFSLCCQRNGEWFSISTPVKHSPVVDRMLFLSDDCFATTAPQDLIQVWDRVVEGDCSHQPIQSWDIQERIDCNGTLNNFWSVSRLVWSHNGNTIFGGARQGLICLSRDATLGPFLLYLHVEAGEMQTFPIPKELHDLVLSPDGSLLAISLEGEESVGEAVEDQVWIWDTQQRLKLFAIPVKNARLVWSSELLACVYWENERGTIKGYGIGHEDVIEVWSHQFKDPEPKSYNVALLRNAKGVVVFGGGLEHAVVIHWKLPTLTELCQEARRQDPQKDAWPDEVKEFVWGD